MMLLNASHGQNPQSSNIESPSESELAVKKYHTEPKQTTTKKRKRIGKTPADKINWTKEEVSLCLKFKIGLNRNFLRYA